jgi:ketosteroid isomerase-like protein
MVRISRFVFVSSVSLIFCCLVEAQSPAPPPVSSQLAVTTTESPEIREFQKIEDAWDNAISLRDQYGLELVLSPLFVDVAASGDITTRNQQLALLITGENKVVSLEQRVITVRMLGDIAVANGTYVLHRKAGSPLEEEKGVFTHVFERTRGGWVCINAQRTLLREDPNAKSKKQSGTETPFHFPTFFHSDKEHQ